MDVSPKRPDGTYIYAPHPGTSSGYMDVSANKSDGAYIYAPRPGGAEYMDVSPKRPDGTYIYAPHPGASSGYMDVSPNRPDGESDYLDVSPEKHNEAGYLNIQAEEESGYLDVTPVPGSVSGAMGPMYADSFISFEPTYAEAQAPPEEVFGFGEEAAHTKVSARKKSSKKKK